jgi:hypothetical protein
VYSSAFSRVIAVPSKAVSVFILKKESYGRGIGGSWAPMSPAARKNEEQCQVQRKKRRRRIKIGRPYVKGYTKDDGTTRWR